MSDKFLRLTYEVPVENAGYAQAALIHVGGKAVAIELVQEIANYNHNAPKTIKGKSVKQIKQDGRQNSLRGDARLRLRKFVDEQFAKGESVTLKAIEAGLPDMKKPALQYHINREIGLKRMKRTKIRGTYARGVSA